MFSGSRNPMVIVKILYLYRVILKLKVIALVHGCGATPWPSPSRSWSGSTAFIHRFSNFMTQQKHTRYRHQDYPSSMFLAKDTKNNKNSSLGPFHFCAVRRQATWETKWQMYRSYVGSAIWETFCKKSRKKLPGKNYRGCNHPLGCRRVNNMCMIFGTIKFTWAFPSVLFHIFHIRSDVVTWHIEQKTCEESQWPHAMHARAPPYTPILWAIYQLDMGPIISAISLPDFTPNP